MATNDELLSKLAAYKKAQNLSESARKLRMILYGTEGVGKTTLVGKFFQAIQGNGKLVIVYDDPGWDTLWDHLPVSMRERVVLIPYQGLEHIELLLEVMKRGGDAAVSLNVDNVDVFCMDTVSAMIEDYLDTLIINTKYEHRNSIIVTTPFEGHKKGAMLAVPHWNDYHLTRNTMRPIIKRLVGLDAHVFLLSHHSEPDENNKENRPNIPKSIITTIAREVSLMGWLKKTTQGERVISFTNTVSAKQRAKSRIQELDGQTLGTDEFIKKIVEWSNK